VWTTKPSCSLSLSVPPFLSPCVSFSVLLFPCLCLSSSLHPSLPLPPPLTRRQEGPRPPGLGGPSWILRPHPVPRTSSRNCWPS
jgi:hypothetical protein